MVLQQPLKRVAMRSLARTTNSRASAPVPRCSNLLSTQGHRRGIVGLPGPGSSAPSGPDPTEPGEDDGKASDKGWKPAFARMFENAATAVASIATLGAFGYGYTQYYKYRVLVKMEHAFEPGDPVLDLALAGKDPEQKLHWVERQEQGLIDDIISGTKQGHYFLIVGEKGQGKTSMILEAMRKNMGEGVAMFEAHADIEIFRIRLGKALDFEYHEDNIGSLFSIRGPRDASALLDIERAFNKLEKVAVRRREKTGKPIIMVINSLHLLRDDEDGRDLLELLQQRAEQWAASNLCTVVMNSDDYWVYERLKQHATRMEILPVKDLTKPMALQALRTYRTLLSSHKPTEEELAEVYDSVGGRLSFLLRVAKADDMLAACDDIYQKERQWFLNQCWILGAEMDDDVMDQQKYASAAMVLAKALVDKEKDMEKNYDDVKGYILPEVPLHIARQIMTRADFMQSYDQINIFTINSRAMVRADSVPMQRAFRDICSEPGFDEYLEATLTRIGDIESLGRTREITIKDLWDGGKYRISVQDDRGRPRQQVVFETVPKPDDDEEAQES